MISLYAHGMSVRDGLPDHRPCAGGGEGLAAEALDPACEVAFPGAIVVKVPGPALAGRPAHQEW